MQIADFFKKLKSPDLGVTFSPNKISFSPPLQSKEKNPARWNAVLELLEKKDRDNENMGPKQNF